MCQELWVWMFGARGKGWINGKLSEEFGKVVRKLLLEDWARIYGIIRTYGCKTFACGNLKDRKYI